MRSKITEFGKLCKSRKKVKEAMINPEAKRTRLAQLVIGEERSDSAGMVEDAYKCVPAPRG